MPRLVKPLVIATAVSAFATTALAWPTAAEIPEVGRNSDCPVALVQVAKGGVAVSTNITRLRNGVCRYDNITIVELTELGRELVDVSKGTIFVQAAEDLPYLDMIRTLNRVQGSGHYNVILGNEPLPS